MSVIKWDDLNQKRKDHAKLSNLDFANSWHTGFLWLDQTTTQTIINWIPLLTGLTPTTDYQIATKKYVDDAVEVENLWDRVGTVLSPHIANDSIDIGSGNIDTTGTLTGINITSWANPWHTHTSTSLPNVETLTTALTAGSVVFSDWTTLSQDNANIFWDIANKRLGIGTATPTSALQLWQNTGSNFLTLAWGTTGNSYWLNWTFTAPWTNIYSQIQIDYDTRVTRGLQINTNAAYPTSFNTIDSTWGFVANIVTIDNNSTNIGFGTTTPTARLDVLQPSGWYAILVGADVSSDSRTDATRKFLRIGCPHYTNAELPVVLFTVDANETTNTIRVGGWTSVGNSATSIRFITAANNTTPSGTEIARFTDVWLGVKTATPTTELDVIWVIRSRSWTLALTDTKTDAAFVLPTGSSIYSLRESWWNLRNLIWVSSTWEITIWQSGTLLVPSITLEAGNVWYVSIVPWGWEAMRIIDNKNVGIGTTTPDSKLQVVWNSRFGEDVTNYSEFETDWTLEFNGTATVWKDINMGSSQLSRPASSQPDIESFVDKNGSDTGIETYWFAVWEKVHGSFEMQHDYKEGSDFMFHVHWQGITAPSGTDNVQWRLTYILMRDGTTLNAVTIIDTPDTTIDTQYIAARSDFAAITWTNYLMWDQFIFTLERVASTGDAYLWDALIVTAGIHYEIDTVGSRQISTK